MKNYIMSNSKEVTSENIEKATTPPWHVARVVEALLDCQVVFGPVITIVKEETDKTEDVKLKRKDRHYKFVETAYTAGAQSTSSSNRLLTDISVERQTNRGTLRSRKSRHTKYRHGRK